VPKENRVAFGVDVDAVAGWLGSNGGEDSPCDISRGMFAGDDGFVHSYCNVIPTPDGGTHEAGLRAAYRGAIRSVPASSRSTGR